MRFEIPIPPMPKLRPRMTRRGRVYTPKKTTDFEGEVQFWISQYDFEPINNGAIRARIDFIYEKPKSIKKSKIYKTTKPDLDNLIKAILDSLNGICYKDDNQIVELSSTKKYGSEDLIVLTLETLDE